MNKGLTQDITTKHFLTPNELGAYLNISPSSVYRLVEKRSIPFYKIGGSLRFKIEDVEEYLQKCLIKSFS